ncbi:hypothetical protein HC174_10535 [Salinimicrobium sp. CDJ15-81-2]|nr:hypothetical protein [Salinimicrobium nanhaiense]
MKKFFFFILFCLIVFFGLTYWSLSIGPSEIYISKIVEPEAITSEGSQNTEKVKVSATNQYSANGLKRFMQGVNYRKAWETPVTAEIFYLDSFEILDEGGGNQTISLDILGPEGALYSLRSVNKDPTPLIPKVAKVLKLENIVRDGISAQHPYGALLAASLAEHAGLLHTHPKIVYVPEQKKLQKFSKPYGYRLYLLEYETEGDYNWTPYKNVVKIVETDELQEMKTELGKRLQIDTKKLIRARLFDLLIGDWDRHAKQWGWVLQQQEDQLVAIPLPGDRDNAFFRIDGVIPTILTNELVQPMVRPFEKDLDHIQGYVYPFDLYFLKNVSEKIFIEEAKALQESLTDEKMAAAMQQWPRELQQLNGDEILEKLISRRDKLQEYAIDFREEIERLDYPEVPLKGSEDLELPAHLKKCFECN